MGRTQWTWTGWIRPTRIDAQNQILYSEDLLGNIADIQLDRDRITVGTYNNDVPGNWTVAIATVPVRVEAWQHIAVTFDASSGRPLDAARLLSGSLPIARRAAAAPVSPAFALDSNIGAVAAGQPAQTYSGAIDDVLIFGRALAAEEIRGTMEPNKRLAAFHASEIEFFAVKGKRYQLQWSDDLGSWTVEGGVVTGEDKPVTHFASSRIYPKRLWRYLEIP